MSRLISLLLIASPALAQFVPSTGVVITPLYTYQVDVTDAASTLVSLKSQFAGSVQVFEDSTDGVWPLAYSVTGSAAGSTTNSVAPGGTQQIPGPFRYGEPVCEIEFEPAGGKSGKFNVQEMSN